MADPVVGITNGVPTSGTGTITTLGQTLLDGANATHGVTTGAAVVTDVAGTFQQYLRGIVKLLAGTLTVASHAVTNAGTFAVQVSSTVSTAVTNAGTFAVQITSNVSQAVTNTGTFAVQATLAAGSAIVGKVNVLFNGTTPDLGSGTAGTATLRTIIDSSQLGALGAAVSTSSVSTVMATDANATRVSQDTNTMLNGNTALTPVMAKVVASSSGVTNIVALTASKKIRVLAMKLTANGAVNVKWQSHVTPTDITGLSYFAAAGDGEVLPFNPLGWFETVAGEALDINLSGAVAVGGHITYVLV